MDTDETEYTSDRTEINMGPYTVRYNKLMSCISVIYANIFRRSVKAINNGDIVHANDSIVIASTSHM